MAKKIIKNKGIGYIENSDSFYLLMNKVRTIIFGAFARHSSNENSINEIKQKIDELVGRTRSDYTKTDVYQVAFCMFHNAIKEYQESRNKPFSETQVNTVVAKLMTEGQYGNPSVVRRQTTKEKLEVLRIRVFPGQGMYALPQLVWRAMTQQEKEGFKYIAQKMLDRRAYSTTTTRVSNRTRRSTTTTPRATIIDRTPPGFGPDVTQESFRQTQVISTNRLDNNATPTRTELNATPDTTMTELVKEAKFKNTLGIEIEYQEVSFKELYDELTKAKISVYPKYLGYHQSVDYDKYKQWRIMHDSSLKDRFGNSYPNNVNNTRNTANIMFGEVVSPILVGERGLLQLIRVLNVMTRVGATNNQSTGLHIHLGIRDQNQPYGITLKGLRNFIVNYIGFEKIIDGYVRESRRQNNHSKYTPSPTLDIFREKRLSDGKIAPVSYRELNDLSEMLNRMTDTEFKYWAKNTLSRGKINPHSNGLLFSFEIRQHGGTIERDTVIGWILFMHYLCVFSDKKISTKYTWKNLRDNILPKALASFWENRIFDMTGKTPDTFDGPSK